MREGAPEQPSREAWRLRPLRQWRGDATTSDLRWGRATSDNDDDLDWTDLQWRSGLDRSDLRLLAWGSSGVALTLRDWGIIVFRFALGFFFLYKALSDFWFSDLLCIGFFFFFFFWRICGYLCNLLTVRLAMGFGGGLP